LKWEGPDLQRNGTAGKVLLQGGCAVSLYPQQKRAPGPKQTKTRDAAWDVAPWHMFLRGKAGKKSTFK